MVACNKATPLDKLKTRTDKEGRIVFDIKHRSARSAAMLVQVRDREPLHRHADSDITVFLLRGEGDMRIGKEALPVKAGSVIHIPRGAVHAYINRGPEPATALVVYSPAPGPKDRILVEDKPWRPAAL